MQLDELYSIIMKKLKKSFLKFSTVDTIYCTNVEKKNVERKNVEKKTSKAKCRKEKCQKKKCRKRKTSKGKKVETAKMSLLTSDDFDSWYFSRIFFRFL